MPPYAYAYAYAHAHAYAYAYAYAYARWRLYQHGVAFLATDRLTPCLP